MEHRTIAHLASIDRALYRDRAQAFSNTRQRPWVGWTRLLELFGAPGVVARPAVLDAGCGNGRFARFLGDALGRPFDYVGVDASAPLLAHGRAAAPLGARLVEGDLIFESMEAILARAGVEPRGFDLVVAMGVMHHVPSSGLRAALVRGLAGAVAPGGLLALSFWEVEDTDAFLRRVPWSEYLAGAGHPFSESDLERGDHLLRFGDALRFAHHTGLEEQAALVRTSGLALVETYAADQKNRYVVLRAG